MTQIGEAIDPDILDDEIKARGDNIVNLRNLTSEVDRLKSAVETTRFNFLQPFLYEGELTVEVTKGINDKMKQLAEEGLPAFEQGVYSVLGALGVDVPANLKKPGSSKNTDVPQSFWQRFGNIFGGVEGGAGSLSAETYLPDDYFSSATNLPAQAGSSIMATATDTGATTNTTTITNNQTVKQNQDELLAEMKKQVAALNTLVTIGAMTEKNTKNMNNNVANMGGSLV